MPPMDQNEAEHLSRFMLSETFSSFARMAQAYSAKVRSLDKTDTFRVAVADLTLLSLSTRFGQNHLYAGGTIIIGFTSTT